MREEAVRFTRINSFSVLMTLRSFSRPVQLIFSNSFRFNRQRQWVQVLKSVVLMFLVTAFFQFFYYYYYYFIFYGYHLFFICIVMRVGAISVHESSIYPNQNIFIYRYLGTTTQEKIFGGTNNPSKFSIISAFSK